jgi:hypothetical protein
MLLNHIEAYEQLVLQSADKLPGAFRTLVLCVSIYACLLLIQLKLQAITNETQASY